MRPSLLHTATEAQQTLPRSDERPLKHVSTFEVGDPVWMRRRGTRCTASSRQGVVTRIVLAQVVEVDGVPWHVRDLRHRYGDDASDADTAGGGDEDDSPLYITTE